MKVKYATKRQEIFRGLNPEIVVKASKIAVGKYIKDNAFQAPIVVKVKDYDVSISLSGDRQDPDIRLSCTCPAWVYQGSEYHANKEDYLFGRPKGNLEEPKVKDPDSENKLCKHTYAVLKTLK